MLAIPSHFAGPRAKSTKWVQATAFGLEQAFAPHSEACMPTWARASRWARPLALRFDARPCGPGPLRCSGLAGGCETRPPEAALRASPLGARPVLATGAPAARRNLPGPALLGVEQARHRPRPPPCRRQRCIPAGKALRCPKAGAGGCGGACAAPSTAAQRGLSPDTKPACAGFVPGEGRPRLAAGRAVPGGPARTLYAAPRPAALRSDRSRPAERGAQGTRSAARGAAVKPPRPPAPALPRRCRQAAKRALPRSAPGRAQAACNMEGRDAASQQDKGVTGKIALICPVPELPKYGVTISAGAS